MVLSVLWVLSGHAARAEEIGYAVLDFPGAQDTIAVGINRWGAVVGDFRYTSSGDIFGYVLEDGTFHALEFPGAAFTSARAINDAGDIVGVFRFADGRDHGFLLSNGTFSRIDVPGASQTTVAGIDDKGTIYGSWCGHGQCDFRASHPAPTWHGFVLRNGSFVTIDVPGAMTTSLWGATGGGRLVGRYAGPDEVFHVFELDAAGLTNIDFPGAAETAAGWYSWTGGVNARGQIASNYCVAEPCHDPWVPFNIHGFVLSKGRYLTVEPPGSVIAGLWGINALGQVAGITIMADGHEHGFVSSPIE